MDNRRQPGVLRFASPWQHSAPRVFRGYYLSLEGVYDEVQRMRLHTLDALLHHVVAVLVLHTLEHVAVQLAHHLALSGEPKDKELLAGNLIVPQRSFYLNYFIFFFFFYRGLSVANK